MSTANSIPRSALLSGLAGLIPFWAAPALALMHVMSDVSIATEAAMYTIYGAIILGFLGGVRWGVAMQAQTTPPGRVLILAVLPSVLGFGAVFVHWSMGEVWGWALIILGLLAQLAWDRAAVSSAVLPAWYGRLRILLTGGASLAGLALIAIYLAAIA